MTSHLRITERRHGDVAVISIAGWLVPDEQDALFSQRIESLLIQGIRNIVLDMHDVSLLDSGGVGILVAKLLTVRDRGGDLRLARLTARSERVLTITHLLTVFTVFTSVEEAVGSFSKASLSAPEQSAGRAV